MGGMVCLETHSTGWSTTDGSKVLSRHKATRIQQAGDTRPKPHTQSLCIIRHSACPQRRAEDGIAAHRNKPDETTLRLFTTSQMNNPLHPPKTAR
mgnify:CR=1 FL=1